MSEIRLHAEYSSEGFCETLLINLLPSKTKSNFNLHSTHYCRARHRFLNHQLNSLHCVYSFNYVMNEQSPTKCICLYPPHSQNSTLCTSKQARFPFEAVHLLYASWGIYKALPFQALNAAIALSVSEFIQRFSFRACLKRHDASCGEIDSHWEYVSSFPMRHRKKEDTSGWKMFSAYFIYSSLSCQAGNWI